LVGFYYTCDNKAKSFIFTATKPPFPVYPDDSTSLQQTLLAIVKSRFPSAKRDNERW